MLLSGCCRENFGSLCSCGAKTVIQKKTNCFCSTNPQELPSAVHSNLLELSDLQNWLASGRFRLAFVRESHCVIGKINYPFPSDWDNGAIIFCYHHQPIESDSAWIRVYAASVRGSVSGFLVRFLAQFLMLNVLVSVGRRRTHQSSFHRHSREIYLQEAAAKDLRCGPLFSFSNGKGCQWITYSCSSPGKNVQCRFLFIFAGSLPERGGGSGVSDRHGRLVPVAPRLLHGQQAARVRARRQPGVRLRFAPHARSHLRLPALLQLLAAAVPHDAQLRLVHGGHPATRVAERPEESLLIDFLRRSRVRNLVHRLAPQRRGPHQGEEIAQWKRIYVTYHR